MSGIMSIDQIDRVIAAEIDARDGREPYQLLAAIAAKVCGDLAKAITYAPVFEALGDGHYRLAFTKAFRDVFQRSTGAPMSIALVRATAKIGDPAVCDILMRTLCEAGVMSEMLPTLWRHAASCSLCPTSGQCRYFWDLAFDDASGRAYRALNEMGWIPDASSAAKLVALHRERCFETNQQSALQQQILLRLQSLVEVVRPHHARSVGL
jgi:hypothetical protein